MTDDVEMGPLYYDESMYNNSKVTFIDDFDPGMGYGEMVYTWWADYSQYITEIFGMPVTKIFWRVILSLMPCRT